MYKLLLVSDQEEVLNTFEQIQNWEYNGFRKPHIRFDAAGAKDSLSKHHADGLVMAMSPEKEHELMVWLRKEYPLLPVCEGGRTTEEARAYLGELEALLNWLRADFSSDQNNEQDMLIRCRRHFFRNLVDERKMTCGELKRGMLLRRSRMDPNAPCVLMTLQIQAEDENQTAGILQDQEHQLEKSLFRSFGGDVQGFHVLPLVTKSGGVYVLAGHLRGNQEEDGTAEELMSVLENWIREGIVHAEEYQGLRLNVAETEVLPSIYALCSDYR